MPPELSGLLLKHATGVLSLSVLLRLSPAVTAVQVIFSSLSFGSQPCMKVNTLKESMREASQSEERDETKRMIDWLGGGGGMLEVVGGYKRKYACSIRNQEMKAPCCYGNTPAVVEYQCCFNDIGTIGF